MAYIALQRAPARRLISPVAAALRSPPGLSRSCSLPLSAHFTTSSARTKPTPTSARAKPTPTPPRLNLLSSTAPPSKPNTEDVGMDAVLRRVAAGRSCSIDDAPVGFEHVDPDGGGGKRKTPARKGMIGEELTNPTIFGEFSLEGKVAVITGGNGGLGLEMGLAFAEAGADVYVLDLPPTPSDDFNHIANHVSHFHPKRTLHYIGQTDVTKPDNLNEVMEHIKNEAGRLDVCVAAAGILQTKWDALDYPPEEFRKVFDVNANGVFFTAQAAARRMNEGGSIILVASMSGSIANRDMHWVPYNSSKSAVVQMARSLACELGPKKIRCNSLSPGHIRTKMTNVLLDKVPGMEEKWASMNPLGRIGRTSEIRGAAVWLASDSSSFVTGSDVFVSGGHESW